MDTARNTRRVWTTLCVLLLSSAGNMDSLCSAQPACGVAQTTPIQVDDATALGTLRAAVNCSGGGTVEVTWAGAVTLDSPISIADGTVLSVTGEDDLAEVLADISLTNGTRLFEVSPGAGLTLSQIKVSGGTAADGGAIFSSSGFVTLDSCVFEGNVATEGNGGAVFARGGNVTIVGAEFLGNSATSYGGAVHITDGWLEVQVGSRFEENEASIGGALFCGSSTVVSASSETLCSITEAEFSSNRATFANVGDDDDATSGFNGGGAVTFLYTDATITDSVFSGNYARIAGGALFGGRFTDISVDGCTFLNNTVEEDGGAIAASSMTLGANTQLANNSAAAKGGAVFGWDATGIIVFNDVFCTDNSATTGGGCFYASGEIIINDGTTMLYNSAEHGGSIYAHAGSDITVHGGEFTCRFNERGGFLYAGDNTTVTITGGLFSDNVSTRRGGVIYCSGNGVSVVSIRGGTFTNNTSLESGGVISGWGADVLVVITGGTFTNNTAALLGGFGFLELGAGIHCEGAMISGNFAGAQGGGLYASEATLMNSSCDLVANESPQGAAIYLSLVSSATLQAHYVTDNVASSGSVIQLMSSYVVAKKVIIESHIGFQVYSINRAVELDDTSTLDAEQCVFDGWRSDVVVLNKNSANGSLILDRCTFSGSSATMVVSSPYSAAEIRNAVVSFISFNDVTDCTVGSSQTLVDRALDCSDDNACGVGACIDSSLGVLCECLDSGEFLNDGGELFLNLNTHPDAETYSPDTVSSELLVSSAANGTTYAIWTLDGDGGELDLAVFPSSGVLPPGGSRTVGVNATTSKPDVGGDMTSRFSLTSVGSASSHSDGGGIALDVNFTFYLCISFYFVMPHDGEDDEGFFSCERCGAIEGQEGVDCENPGATLASLPIRPGYWRANQESLVVQQCANPAACVGAVQISNSDDYCEIGYTGPYCAVCAAGYGKSLSNGCHSCSGTMARWLIAACTVFAVMVLLLLFLASVFLIGGLEALSAACQSITRRVPILRTSSRKRPSVQETSLSQRKHSEISIRLESMDCTLAPVDDFESGGNWKVGESVTVYGRESALQCSGQDASALTHTRPAGVAVEVRGWGRTSSMSDRNALSDEAIPQQQTQQPFPAGARLNRANGERELGGKNTGGEKYCVCGLDKVFKGRVPRFPITNIKILVGVWQILSVFASITGVKFPGSYSAFLSWINVLNFDVGYIVSASCVVPSMNFYQRLLATTLAPLVLASQLVWTYRMANKRAGVGSAREAGRKAAWSRHMAAGLLLTFLVFTSASSTVLKTFACDDSVVDGESYLRADYTISCQTGLHSLFKVYAGFMILVYPIGVPALYLIVLWRKRELLNPRIYSISTPEGDGASEEATGGAFGGANGTPSAILLTASNGQTKAYWSPQELQELDQKVKARTDHPELVPFIFLWRDFGPNLYYYEVVECGRRMLLTEVLIFIDPQSAQQAAMACIFAFVSLLAFELLRPHVDPADSWLYRLGCVMIFMSYFLALLIKMDAAGEENIAALGGFLVAVNVLLIFAVLSTLWFAMRHLGDDSRDEGNTYS